LELDQFCGSWEIQTKNNNEYVFIEFNTKGNYFIETTDSNYFFGYYEIVDDKSLDLMNFGKATFNSIHANLVNFSLKNEDDNSEISVDATKIPRISYSEKTEELCRLWDMISINGYPIEEQLVDYIIMYFTYTGNFFMSYRYNFKIEEDSGILYWKWLDSEEETICYSPESNFECNPDYKMQVIIENDELTLIDYGTEMKFVLY